MSKRIEANIGRQAGLHFVNQMRGNVRFQQKGLRIGHHIQKLLARLQHSAHSLHREAHHLPRGWRFDFHAIQIGRNRYKFLCIRLHFTRHLGQLRFHFFAVLLFACH